MVIRMQERVRIVDIAEELGVSTATVSNVIHGKTGKISKETVKRVQQLLEEREYIPSMAGILLAQNSSRIIGVVIHNHEKYGGQVLTDAFIAASLDALSTETDRAGYFMMVKTTAEWEEIPRFASMWNMEGLVIIGFCEQDYKSLRDAMRIPFVVYDGFLKSAERLCNLTIDNYSGGFQMGEHFRELGHKRALCISDNDICMDLERFHGFRAAFGENGTTLLVVPMEKSARRQFYAERLKWLKSFSAVFAVSDYYAADYIQFIQENGMRVPEDTVVGGFDDSPLCELIHPALTTIRQDSGQRAKLAIELLQDMKEKKTEGGEIRLPVSLIKRGSTERKVGI